MRWKRVTDDEVHLLGCWHWINCATRTSYQRRYRWANTWHVWFMRAANYRTSRSEKIKHNNAGSDDGIRFRTRGPPPSFQDGQSVTIRNHGTSLLLGLDCWERREKWILFHRFWPTGGCENSRCLPTNTEIAEGNNTIIYKISYYYQLSNWDVEEKRNNNNEPTTLGFSEEEASVIFLSVQSVG